MGAKGEISWKRRGEYGERMEYYARNERGVWKFFQRERRFEKWESYVEPEFDDWLELLDGVRRRSPRRKRSRENSRTKRIRSDRGYFTHRSSGRTERHSS